MSELTSMRTLRIAALMAALTLALPACTDPGGGAGDRPTVRVAFLQDLTVPSHVDLVSPSFLAFEQALREGAEGLELDVEVVQMDTEADPARAAGFAQEIAADPSYVAAVVAPFWAEPPEVAATLAEAGVTTLSLSPQSPSPWSSAAGGAPPRGTPLELWRRLVPDQSEQAATLAALIGSGQAGAAPDADSAPSLPACVFAEDGGYAVGLRDSIVDSLPPDLPIALPRVGDLAAAVDQVRRGCSQVVWLGSTDGAAELAGALGEAGLGAQTSIDLSSDALKTVSPSGHRTLEDVRVRSVTCPCVDVTTALDPEARLFVNTYQSANGLAPGVYAAEGWDAGQILAFALSDGATDRTSLRGSIAGAGSWDGVAGSLAFDELGELRDARVHVFGAAGTRWLEVTDRGP